jgi:hypothetical protein
VLSVHNRHQQQATAAGLVPDWSRCSSGNAMQLTLTCDLKFGRLLSLGSSGYTTYCDVTVMHAAKANPAMAAGRCLVVADTDTKHKCRSRDLCSAIPTRWGSGKMAIDAGKKVRDKAAKGLLALFRSGFRLQKDYWPCLDPDSGCRIRVLLLQCSCRNTVAAFVL